jgi:hypothetical protein
MFLLILNSRAFASGGYNAVLGMSGSTTALPSAFTWTGKNGDGNFNTAGNWWGGVVPSSTNLVVFDYHYCSTNCNVTLNANVNVLGVVINGSYPGTITQPTTKTITVGTSGWYQNGGAFVGGNSAITVNGSFEVVRGAFTATSATLTINSSTKVTLTGTFAHNSGSLTIQASNSTYNLGSNPLNTVTFSCTGGNNTMDFSGVTTSILGNIVFSCNYSTNVMNNGELDAVGNVSVTGTNGDTGSLVIKMVGNISGQTVSSTTSTSNLPNLIIAAGTNPVTFGTYVKTGNYTFTSASSLTVTGSTLIVGKATATVSINPGRITYNNVSFLNSRSNYDLNSSTLKIGGNFSLGDGYGGYGVINSGAIEVTGNITTNGYSSGTATIKLLGNASGSTITGGAGTIQEISNLEIATGTNPVTLSAYIAPTGTYTVTSMGTLTTTGSRLYFKGGNTITTGSEVYNDVLLTGSSSLNTYNLNSSTIKVGGTLTLASAYSITVNSGTLAAYGNVTTPSSVISGTAVLDFRGATNVTNTGVNGVITVGGDVVVNLTGGSTLSLLSATSWNYSTSDSLTVNSGSIDRAGYALTVKALSLNGNTITKNGGVLKVNGTTVGTGSLYGGTINP